MGINGNVIYHKIDKNSYLIKNTIRSLKELNSKKHSNVIFFGEVLPKFPTSLLTKKEIMDNKKGGTYSEARSKKKTYKKRRTKVSCDHNIEFLEARFEKYKEMGYSDEKAKDLAYKDLENEGFLW